jgi:hypothetical protein
MPIFAYLPILPKIFRLLSMNHNISSILRILSIFLGKVGKKAKIGKHPLLGKPHKKLNYFFVFGLEA